MPLFFDFLLFLPSVANHQQLDQISDDDKGGEKTNHREDERANGVEDVVVGNEVDHQRGDIHAQTWQRVGQNVKERGSHLVGVDDLGVLVRRGGKLIA